MTRAALLMALALALAACAPVPVDTGAGCQAYGAERSHLPRPLPDSALGVWVAVTDAGMTGACR